MDIKQLEEQVKNTITKRVHKKEFINDLRAIPSEYVSIQFNKDSNQIIIQQPNSYKYICHISRD